MENPKKYDVIITSHARQRWVERIADPKRYGHLKRCHLENCEKCSSLLYDIHGIIKAYGKTIDGAIVQRYRRAKTENSKVTDVSFLKAMAKQHGDLACFEFLRSENAVFMTKLEENTPILITVMGIGMIDGTVLRNFSKEELKTVFHRWKREIKNNKHAN